MPLLQHAWNILKDERHAPASCWSYLSHLAPFQVLTHRIESTDKQTELNIIVVCHIISAHLIKQCSKNRRQKKPTCWRRDAKPNKAVTAKLLRNAKGVSYVISLSYSVLPLLLVSHSLVLRLTALCFRGSMPLDFCSLRTPLHCANWCFTFSGATTVHLT